MKITMKESGKAFYDKWEGKYQNELERLRKEYNDPEFHEGWGILETDAFIKTIDDAVGLLIFGYDTNVLGVIDEWIEQDGEDDTVYGFKLGDVLKLVEKHYEWKRTPKEIADNWRKVVGIKKSSEGNRPDLDAKAIVDVLGLDSALQTFACVIQIKKNDGRFYGKVKEYFLNIEVDESATVWDRENPVIRAGLDDIHPAHIQQIAQYVMQIAEEQ